MGPPGGPPLIHHLHKPHLQPQIPPMMHPHNISVISPSIAPQSLIRFAQHPYNIMPMPTMQMEHVDSKLMEKFVEFLKMQSTNDMSIADVMNQAPSTIVPETDGKGQIEYCHQEPDRMAQSHISPMIHGHVDKDHSVPVEKGPAAVAKESNNELGDKDAQRKTSKG